MKNSDSSRKALANRRLVTAELSLIANQLKNSDRLASRLAVSPQAEISPKEYIAKLGDRKRYLLNLSRELDELYFDVHRHQSDNINNNFTMNEIIIDVRSEVHELPSISFTSPFLPKCPLTEQFVFPDSHKLDVTERLNNDSHALMSSDDTAFHSQGVVLISGILTPKLNLSTVKVC